MLVYVLIFAASFIAVVGLLAAHSKKRNPFLLICEGVAVECMPELAELREVLKALGELDLTTGFTPEQQDYAKRLREIISLDALTREKVLTLHLGYARNDSSEVVRSMLWLTTTYSKGLIKGLVKTTWALAEMGSTTSAHSQRVEFQRCIRKLLSTYKSLDKKVLERLGLDSEN